MIVANNQIDNKKTYMSNAGNFNRHVDTVVQCGVHHPMVHIPGFTRSHWMMPLGECMHRIALVAAMVNKFFENTKLTTNYFQLVNLP